MKMVVSTAFMQAGLSSKAALQTAQSKASLSLSRLPPLITSWLTCQDNGQQTLEALTFAITPKQRLPSQCKADSVVVAKAVRNMNTHG
jgi:hypothetical protein